MKFATHQLGQTEMDPFQCCVWMALNEAGGTSRFCP